MGYFFLVSFSLAFYISGGDNNPCFFSIHLVFYLKTHKVQCILLEESCVCCM